MEDQLKKLSKNRELMSLILSLAESINKLIVITKSTAKQCSEQVVDAVLAILDTADKYEDDALQNSLEPLKHKLKVGIAELRTCCEGQQSLPFIRHHAVPLSIALVVSLEEFELAALEKAHDVAVESVQELESLYGSQAADVPSRILGALKNVLPFLKKAQQRASSLPQRCLFDGFVDTAAVQKFYIYFLASVSGLLTEHSGSRHVKILWCFAIRQAGLWLSKLRDLACGVSSHEFLDGWMGAFVSKVDEALYHLGHKLEADFYSAVDAVTSHGMSVCHLCPEVDRDKLITAYKEVLECKLDLEKAEHCNAGDKASASKRKKMKATLENFEELVNIALVELIVQNYMRPASAFSKLLEVAKEDPLKKECNNSTPDLSALYKNEADAFCASVDTTYSIAHLAAGCTTDARSVGKLWEHLRLMEWLDPELVAAVMSLVSSSDEGLVNVLERMQGAWDFHIQGLFRSLLHLTEPIAFFVCLDVSLKRSIAALADSSVTHRAAADIVSEIITRTSSVQELTAVAFEASTIPESVQAALKNLKIARLSLKRASVENRLKGAKIVRGCVKAVHEEVDSHLDIVSEPPSHFPSHLLTGLTSPTVSRNPTQDGKSLDLDITALLETMESRICDSFKPPGTETGCSKAETCTAIPREECSNTELSERQVEHLHISRVRRSIQSNTFTKASWRETLSRSLWYSDRSLCTEKASCKNWLQNNSIIYTLIHEVQLLVMSILEAQGQVCCPDSLSKLADLGHKLVAEVSSVCSRLGSVKQNSRLLEDVKKAKDEIAFTARQVQLFSDLGKEKSVENTTIAPFAQNFLLLASEILKTLPILCDQCHNSTRADSPSKLALERSPGDLHPHAAASDSCSSA